MKNEMSSLILQQPAANLSQQFFEFSWLLTPAMTLHYSFFIFHSYNEE
jgi:hypothetical protein